MLHVKKLCCLHKAALHLLFVSVYSSNGKLRRAWRFPVTPGRPRVFIEKQSDAAHARALRLVRRGHGGERKTLADRLQLPIYA
jgi:hypothetical protein